MPEGSSVEVIDYTFPDQPSRFDMAEFNRLLVFLEGLGCSDVNLQSFTPIYADIYGRLRVVVERPLIHAELEEIINGIYGANGSAQISGGQDVDTAYEVRVERGKRLRFRVNAVGCMASGRQSMQITARSIPVNPPGKEMIGFDDYVWKNFAPPQGLVLVTGATGSGKSTLLAACIRKLLEEVDGNRKFLTYESPIEFVYDNVDKPSSMISQSEVPRHIPTFAAGVRNALRRKPHVILIGEARDTETIEACIEAAQTGHLVYTTSHTNGVAETIQRLVMAFPAGQRSMIKIDLLNVIKLIITQRLVRSLDGKRVALREYLVIDSDIRDILVRTAEEDIVTVIREVLRKNGTSMIDSARGFYESEKISKREYEDILIAYGG